VLGVDLFFYSTRSRGALGIRRRRGAGRSIFNLPLFGGQGEMNVFIRLQTVATLGESSSEVESADLRYRSIGVLRLGGHYRFFPHLTPGTQ